MKTFLRIIILAFLFDTLTLSCVDSANPEEENPSENPAISPRPAKSGIYAIWYGSKTTVLSLPMIIGGQVVVQWKDVEKSKGTYDFSSITAKSAELKAIGKYATIQINGNNKPAYLFDEVPWVTEKLSQQVQDVQGSLMYWHPNHVNAYTNLLKALGVYLAERKSDFIGIRMNYNPFGTEHTHLADLTYRDASIWNYPPGVEAGTNWTSQVGADYQKKIRETYLNEIAPYIRVFVRNGIDTKAEPEFDTYFSEGTLSLFHTSSESEPRSAGVEKQYQNFYTYCRSGKTTAYAEPWASSLGHHGGKTDDRAESMPQWFYWRLLVDLHCGVSHIAVYGDDLEVAVNGKYSNSGIIYHDDATAGTNYQKEFYDALLFASKYAGYHASAASSPGAWVAFRGNDLVRNANDITEANRKLSFLTGDYDFLMKRLPDNSIPVEFIGSRDSRFGSWARKLPSGEKMVLEPDPALLHSLSKPSVKLIWFDDASGKGKLSLNAGNETFTTDPKRDGKWKETTFALAGNDFNNIEVKALEGDAVLHMVEIIR
jgi:hypothetical protein